jgi:hypothetical protein
MAYVTGAAFGRLTVYGSIEGRARYTGFHHVEPGKQP